MDVKTAKELESFAILFSETADDVNEHSKKRKEIADSINNDIMKAVALASDINSEIKRVTQANTEWSETDNSILSVFYMLQSNISKQNEYYSRFKNKKVIAQSILDEMISMTDVFSASLKRARETLNEIIIKENEIILLDNLLEYKKKYQIDALRTLKKLADAVGNDAYTAITGSSENRERGIRLRETAGKITVSPSENVFAEMIEDVRTGRELAEKVLKNSKSQDEFNEQVLNFTSDFINESETVKNLINQKHLLFEDNLQTITVFTVIISFEFKKYLEVQKLFAKLQMPDTMRDEYLTLMMLVDIACRDIKFLTELNYDMTETSHKTNESETRTVEMSDEESVLFRKIREQLTLMTDMTRIPIEGAARNIGNAKKIEEILMSLAENSDEVKTDFIKDSIKKEDTNMSSQKTIMVIDDGAAIRQVVSQVLTADGFLTIEAVDGQDALNKLEGKKIDMFICDVNMPNLNGIQFLEAVRTDEKYREFRFTPIVMLTTEAGEAMKEKGKQLGAKAWIVKPFQPDQLLEKIRPLLG